MKIFLSASENAAEEAGKQKIKIDI